MRAKYSSTTRLGVGLDVRTDIEQVTRDDDQVVVGRHGRDPVQLLQRVVQIGDQQQAHRRDATGGAAAKYE